MERIKFAAYWIVDGKSVRVFPKSKKTSFFTTKELAVRKLESITKTYPTDTRGIVRGTDGTETGIAL